MSALAPLVTCPRTVTSHHSGRSSGSHRVATTSVTVALGAPVGQGTGAAGGGSGSSGSGGGGSSGQACSSHSGSSQSGTSQSGTSHPCGGTTASAHQQSGDRKSTRLNSSHV